MFLWGCFLQVLAVIIDNDIVFVYSQILVTSILGWLGHDIPLLWSNISLYFQFEEYMDSRDTRSGAFTLTFTLIFTLTFTLTFTLHLQIDGASSRSIECHFISCLRLKKLKFWKWDKTEVWTYRPIILSFGRHLEVWGRIMSLQERRGERQKWWPWILPQLSW